MTHIAHLAVAVLASLTAPKQVPACDLVDLSAAEMLLGAGANEITDGADDSRCVYMDPSGQGNLTAQVTSETLYDMVVIKEPHTDIDIGVRGRFNIDEHGTVALQFVKGGFHVWIGMVPLPDSSVDFDVFEQVARAAADRVP